MRVTADLRQRLAALAAMGGQCQRCGDCDYRVLEFAHRVPVKRKHAGSDYSKHSGSNLVRQVLLLGPRARKLFRVLCSNCHRRSTHARGEWSAGGHRRA